MNRFDIFICGGSQHVAMLRPLLAKLRPFGKVHLASCFLSGDDLQELHGLYDVLHTPRHSDDGYHNFELFSIRDMHRLATAPYFVKLDADIEVDDDWIAYVDECIAAHSEAVLFGPRKGQSDVTLELSGEVVRDLLGHDVRVAGAPKIIGGFFGGKTMRVGGDIATFRSVGNEDTLRSLVVHAVGASDRLHVFDSRGKVRIYRTNTPDA